MQPGTPSSQPNLSDPQHRAASQEGASKIHHSRPGLGSGFGSASPGAAHESASASEESHPTSVAGSALSPTAQKITTFGRDRKHEDNWTRTPNTTGSGAIHVRTFSCKLTEDALAYMDQAVNEWLDAHPQYEVKFVSNSVGVMTGKLKEPALICQVWV